MLHDYRLQAGSPCIGTGRYGRDRGAIPFEPTGIADNGHLPGKFELFSVYPNPFNSAANIQFDLEKECRAELTAYNLLGQEVATIYAGLLPSGNHATTWKPSDPHRSRELPSGVYLVRLRTSDLSAARKILYLK